MVYARALAGRKLTFIVSGKLWRNSLIMQDLETGTLWSHVSGEALEGPLKGETLAPLPSVQTRWADWIAAHPESEVLRKSEAVSASRYAAYFADPERTGIFRAHYLMDRMPGKAQVLGLVLGPHALAVSDSLLRAEGLVQGELAGEAVTLRLGADGGVRAWRGAWSWDGQAGRLVGEGVAVELPVQRAYWFAWSAFYPNTAVLD